MDNVVSQEGFTTLDEYREKNGGEQLELFQLQEFAVKNTDSLSGIEEKLKRANEMLTDVYLNEPTYKEQQEKVKEQQKQLKVIKSQIESQPSVIGLINQVKEIKSEKKDRRVMISDYALEIYRRSGVTEFDRDGQTFEIKTVAKIVKKKQ